MTAPVIRYRGFEKWYGALRAAGPIDLDIAPGESFVLLGPNGSGKSTMLRALMGLIRPTRGEITVGGDDVRRRPEKVRRNMGYLPQRLSLPEILSGREVVSLFAKLRGVDSREVEARIEQFVLTNDADRPVREYSGGMLQRLGLALALLGDPAVLILDEPTLNLDPLGRDAFRSHLMQLRDRGVTIVFSSHILQDAEQLAGRVGVVVEGRLASLKGIAEFRENLSLETTVRVVLNAADKVVADAARIAGATALDWHGSHFLFKASPDCRLAVIRAIEEAGGIITEFHYDPPNWEALVGKEFEGGNGNGRKAAGV